MYDMTQLDRCHPSRVKHTNNSIQGISFVDVDLENWRMAVLYPDETYELAQPEQYDIDDIFPIILQEIEWGTPLSNDGQTPTFYKWIWGRVMQSL